MQYFLQKDEKEYSKSLNSRIDNLQYYTEELYQIAFTHFQAFYEWTQDKMIIEKTTQKTDNERNTATKEKRRREMKLSIRTLETLDVMPEDHKPKHEHISVSP